MEEEDTRTVELLEARLAELKGRVASLRSKSSRAVFEDQWAESKRTLAHIVQIRPSTGPVIDLAKLGDGQLVELLEKKVRGEAVDGSIWVLPDVFRFPPEQLKELPPPLLFFTHPQGQNYTGPFYGGKMGHWQPFRSSSRNVKETGSQSDGVTFKKFECRGWILKIWTLSYLIEGGQNGWSIGVMERTKIGPLDRILR